ncbi:MULTISPECIES: AAA family ATPase [Maricaulis]|uniref:Response regulator receiver protein n=1 Tax=Maricaulis maris TaxID=74318 RepID=A0A495DLI0_9PROT|nr:MULTISPECIES: AAA family ATPase [Maricaulis]RKR03784.1 response regulator receiver protein [Maricaulis maris]
MTDANRALKQDPFLDGDDPFLDAADVERLLLGEATREEMNRPPAQQAPVDTFDDDFGDDPFLSDAAPVPAKPERVIDPVFEDVQDEVAAIQVGESLYGEVDNDVSDQPVPRISVGAFCERPETGALIHNAANDRRLAKAHVTVELGGLPAAIERYHDETTPNLLIIESGMRGRGLFDQLEELAGVCDPDTKVIIIGAANDISLYRELMKRGVSEYLVPPMTPIHVIRTISELFLDPEQPFAGKTIAFIGAKGGVGSSTIAHNATWALTEGMQSDAVLVDLDLSFGTAGLDFNQDPAQTLGDALAEPDRLDDALLDRLLVRCTDRLSLFSAPATLDKEWDFGTQDYEMVLEKVRRQAPYVALDLPHMWTPWVKQTLLAADQVVVTVAPDLASLRNAKNLFDLVAGARPNDEPPRVVINMAGMPKRPEIPIKDFAEALGTPPTLVLPFEPQLFGKAANNGQMITELDPKSKAAEGFSHLASLVSGRTPVAMPKRSLIAKLFGG